MLIKFYKTSSEPKSYPKVLQNELVVNGTIRDENGFDIMNPTLRIVDINPLSYNYLYIEEFSRYYFIVKPIYYRNNVYDLVLHEDVLQSHYAKFELLDAFINRNENDYNPMIKDDRIPLYPSQNDIIVPLYENKPFVKPSNINDCDIVIGVTASQMGGESISNETIIFESGTSTDKYDSYIITQLYNADRVPPDDENCHRGIDLQPRTTYQGSVIDTAAKICYTFDNVGTVIGVKNDWDASQGTVGMLGFGNYVHISFYDGGTSVIYGHLSSVDSGMTVGAQVHKDDIIGIVGNTGKVKGQTGIHLHLAFYSTNTITKYNSLPPNNFYNFPQEVYSWVKGYNSD